MTHLDMQRGEYIDIAGSKIIRLWEDLDRSYGDRWFEIDYWVEDVFLFISGDEFGE